VRFKAEVLSAGRRSYSRKRWYVEGAKKPETRQRRVEKAIEDLKDGAT